MSGSKYWLLLMVIGAIGMCLSLINQQTLGCALGGISFGVGTCGFVLTEPKEPR
jgi:hypothetical protein